MPNVSHRHRSAHLAFNDTEAGRTLTGPERYLRWTYFLAGWNACRAAIETEQTIAGGSPQCVAQTK